VPSRKENSTGVLIIIRHILKRWLEYHSGDWKQNVPAIPEKEM